MRWFFLLPDAAATWPPPVGAEVELDPEESHHLLAVLRRRSDEPVHLVDGRGHRFAGRLAGATGRRARVVIEDVSRDGAETAPPRLRLVCGVVKGRRWTWALEKAVELGVHAVVPLLAERGVVEPGRGRRERWLGVLRAALKQSGRAWLPDLTEPVGLEAALAATDDGPRFWCTAPAEATAGEAAEPSGTADWWTVFIGPEGGWTADERAALAGAGLQPFSLGPHVLRTETAAAAALAVLQSWRTP